MGKVTLIGRSMARVGQRFRYVGQADECDLCDLSSICHNLEKGSTYRITAVREKEHPCAVHLDDKVVVVEIVEEPLEVSIPARKALEGALVALDETECPVRWCPNHFLCTKAYLRSGQKVLIVSLGADLDCPRGLKLKRATVERKED